MTNITIHDIDEDLQTRLSARARVHGHSVEEEVRAILRTTFPKRKKRPRNLAAAIRSKIEPLGGVELELPPRD